MSGPTLVMVLTMLLVGGSGHPQRVDWGIQEWAVFLPLHPLAL